MASTFTTLGIEKMATGENAGTWGDKTNTNLDIVNTALSGYVEQSIAGGAATTALSITDGAATSVAQNAVIKINRINYRKPNCNCTGFCRKSLYYNKWYIRCFYCTI